MDKVLPMEQAIDLIRDGATVVITGSGGRVMEPNKTLSALEKKFLETGSPNHLTLVHASGIGSKDADGVNRAGVNYFAHKGMVKRVIGGHWGWSPRMQQMANDNEIEAYNLSQGVIVQLYREIAAKRPGLVTKIGMHTFVDPRVSGGKLNEITKEDIVEVVNLRGEEWLLYHIFPVDVAIIRGTTADTAGNITMEQEPAFLDLFLAAQAAHNSGGKVIAQVKYLAREGTLDPQSVKIPGVYVDAVIVDPSQMQTEEGEYNPAFCGKVKIPHDRLKRMPLTIRKLVARRAFMELREGMVINLGFGMPDGVAQVVAEESFDSKITMTIEQGLYGGVPAAGNIFGVASNPIAMIDEGAQFDFYSGHGLDATCLGFAQADQHGNVNVSKFGPIIPGSGGFIDISQSAKKVVFCGTFTAGGLKAEIHDNKLVVLQEGSHKKFLKDVEQVTFSGDYANSTHQKVIYVTERATFELTENGLTLIEIAPGIDLQTQVLDLMDFIPEISSKLKVMDLALFREEPMNS